MNSRAGTMPRLSCVYSTVSSIHKPSALGCSQFSLLCGPATPHLPVLSSIFWFFLVCKNGLVSACKITWVLSRPTSLCLQRWLWWWSLIPRYFLTYWWLAWVLPGGEPWTITQLWWLLFKEFLTGRSGKPFFNLRCGMLMDIITLDSSGHNFLLGPYGALLLSDCLSDSVLSIFFVSIYYPINSSP